MGDKREEAFSIVSQSMDVQTIIAAFYCSNIMQSTSSRYRSRFSDLAYLIVYKRITFDQEVSDPNRSVKHGDQCGCWTILN